MNALTTTHDKFLSVRELTKTTALFILAIFLLGLHASAQRVSHNPSIWKLNITPMFSGEYGLGLEHKLTKRTSIYGEISYLNKDQSEISGTGFGTKAGLRYFFDIKRSYKHGTHKSKMKAFSGHYLSIEGRRGGLTPHAEFSTTDDIMSYSKVAVHYGMQRTWKHFFLNAEFGPSWGSSDFADINDRGYYTDGYNIDGRITLGLAF